MSKPAHKSGTAAQILSPPLEPERSRHPTFNSWYNKMLEEGWNLDRDSAEIGWQAALSVAKEEKL